MQLIVQRLHLRPQLVGQLGKIIGGHVIAGPPHRADISIAKVLCTLIGNLDKLGVIAAHRGADIVVPARPHLGELGRIADGAHFGFDIGPVDRLAIERTLALAVGRIEARRDVVQFLGRFGRRGCGQNKAAAQDIELALGVVAEARRIHIPRGFAGQLDRHFGAFSTHLGRNSIGIISDVGVIDPLDLRVEDRELRQRFLGISNKLVRFSGGRRRLLRQNRRGQRERQAQRERGNEGFHGTLR